MMDKSILEDKLGEAIGLERAAQKAVEELGSRGLLKEDQLKKLNKIKDEANNQEQEMLKLVDTLTESEGLEEKKIESMAEETLKKASEMMSTYLGNSPDTQEALEFLCIAEGGELIHYNVLDSLSKELKNREMGRVVRSIQAEEERHLKSCINMAKENIRRNND